jgi:hypothetical protein
VIHGKITEIEHVLARNMRPDRMQNLIAPRPGLLADVSDSDKTSREEMLTAADTSRPCVDTIPMGGGTSNLQAGEIFKIRAGKNHEIEAMGTSLPYGTKKRLE